MRYRKIGGLHFVTLGRLCLMFCLRRRSPGPAPSAVPFASLWPGL